MTETDKEVFDDQLYYMKKWANENGKELELEFYLDTDKSIQLYFKSNGKQVGEKVHFHGQSEEFDRPGKPFNEKQYQGKLEYIEELNENADDETHSFEDLDCAGCGQDGIWEQRYDEEFGHWTGQCYRCGHPNF